MVCNALIVLPPFPSRSTDHPSREACCLEYGRDAADRQPVAPPPYSHAGLDGQDDGAKDEDRHPPCWCHVITSLAPFRCVLLDRIMLKGTDIQ